MIGFVELITTRRGRGMTHHAISAAAGSLMRRTRHGAAADSPARRATACLAPAKLREDERLAAPVRHRRRTPRVLLHVRHRARHRRPKRASAGGVAPAPILRPHVDGHQIDAREGVRAVEVVVGVGLEGRGAFATDGDQVTRRELLDQILVASDRGRSG